MDKAMKSTRPRVALVKTDYERLVSQMDRVFALGEAPDPAAKNRTVVIKINLCDARTPETGAVTHPRFLDALLGYLRERHADLSITVVESDSLVVLADEFIRWFGILPVLNKWNARFVNLSRDGLVPTKIDGAALKEISIPATLAQGSYFISLAKLKTNLLTKITASLKNQFGCLPDLDKNRHHPRIHDVVVDVNQALRPDFAIVDGIVAMGGVQGPAFGIPIPAGLVISGRDLVAVDSCCAEVMGLRPSSIAHIRKAKARGLGSTRFERVGDPPGDTDFLMSPWQMRIFTVGSAIKKRTMNKSRRKGAEL